MRKLNLEGKAADFDRFKRSWDYALLGVEHPLGALAGKGFSLSANAAGTYLRYKNGDIASTSGERGRSIGIRVEDVVPATADPMILEIFSRVKDANKRAYPVIAQEQRRIKDVVDSISASEPNITDISDDDLLMIGMCSKAVNLPFRIKTTCFTKNYTSWMLTVPSVIHKDMDKDQLVSVVFNPDKSLDRIVFCSLRGGVFLDNDAIHQLRDVSRTVFTETVRELTERNIIAPEHVSINSNEHRALLYEDGKIEYMGFTITLGRGKFMIGTGNVGIMRLALQVGEDNLVTVENFCCDQVPQELSEKIMRVAVSGIKEHAQKLIAASPDYTPCGYAKEAVQVMQNTDMGFY